MFQLVKRWKAGTVKPSENHLEPGLLKGSCRINKKKSNFFCLVSNLTGLRGKGIFWAKNISTWQKLLLTRNYFFLFHLRKKKKTQPKFLDQTTFDFVHFTKKKVSFGVGRRKADMMVYTGSFSVTVLNPNFRENFVGVSVTNSLVESLTARKRSFSFILKNKTSVYFFVNFRLRWFFFFLTYCGVSFLKVRFSATIPAGFPFRCLTMCSHEGLRECWICQMVWWCCMNRAEEI